MDEDDFEEEHEGGGSPILAILLLLVIILLGAVGYLGYLMNEKGFFDESEEGDTQTQEVVQKKPAKEVNEKVEKVDPYEKPDPAMFSASIDNLVLNVVNNRGREKLMKLSYSLEGPYEQMEMLIEKHKDAIVDATIRVTASTSSNELLTIAGKMHFNAMLKKEINLIINKAEKLNPEIPENVVKKIYFKAFVMR